MLNQIELEGHLVRAWEYREQRYLRLANHRPGEQGRETSNYITVQVDASLEFNPLRIPIGQVLRVTGRLVGRDILEPVRNVIAKSHPQISLPGELSTLVVRRPTTHVLATRVRVLWQTRRSPAPNLTEETPAPRES